MLALITGGSGSGKSRAAEDLAVRLHAERGEGRLIYAATMRHTGTDAETDARIRRHREARAGKGFETLERERNFAELSFAGRDTVLLEDLSNLLANELYGDPPAADIRASVLTPLLSIAEKGSHLVIVTNQISLGVPAYAPETMRFIRLLEELNCLIAERADYVAEICCGIPLTVKANPGGDIPRRRSGRSGLS